MILLRWVAILWSLIILVALFSIPRGVASTILAIAFAALFLFICWTFGAFAGSDPNRKAYDHEQDLHRH